LRERCASAASVHQRRSSAKRLKARVGALYMAMAAMPLPDDSVALKHWYAAVSARPSAAA
jgi:hypothetical protein